MYYIPDLILDKQKKNLNYIMFLQENNIVSFFSGNKFFEKKVHKWQSR